MKCIVRKLVKETTEGCSPFQFSFVSEDGSLLLQSKRYKAKDSAFKGVRAVMKHCINDKRYDVSESLNGMYLFAIKSANGSPVVNSRAFTTMEELTDTIKSIKALLPNCEVEFQPIHAH